MSSYKEVLTNTKLRADPVSCLEDLQTALDMVLKGYEVERVTPKGQLVSILERHPDVVPKIIKAKMDVLEVLRKEQETDVSCQLIVPGLDLARPTEMQRYPE